MDFNEALLEADTLNATLKSKIAKSKEIFFGEPLGNEVDGRSRIVWKLAKKQSLTMIANLDKAFRGKSIVAVDPVGEDDAYKAKIDEALINYFWNKKHTRINFLKRLTTVLVSEGNAIARVGWKIKKKDGKVVLKQPTQKVLRTENVYIDPNAENLQEAKYIIYKYTDRVDNIKRNKEYDQKVIESTLGSQSSDDIFRSETDSAIHKQYIGSDVVTLYEFWYRDKEGNIKFEVHLEGEDKKVENEYGEVETKGKKRGKLKGNDSPFPFDRFPFILINLHPTPFSLFSDSLPELIFDEQKVTTSIVRGVIDNMALSNNATKFIRKNSLDEINLKRLQAGEPYVEVRTTGSIRDVVVDGSFNQIPQSVFNVFALFEDSASETTGVNKMMGGNASTQDLKAPATNVQLMMTQSQIKLENVIDNIAFGLYQMFKMWVAMFNEWLTEADIELITGINISMLKEIEMQRLAQQYGLDQIPDEETRLEAQLLIAQKVDELFNNKYADYDIDIKVGSDAKKTIKVQQLNMLMQQLAPLASVGAVPQKAMQLLVADLAEALDRPDIAKLIEQYEPQPDQLEIMEKQAEIEYLKAKAMKEQALAQNALGRTKQTEVKAQKEMLSIDPEVGQKYADLAKKYAEIEKLEKEAEGETNEPPRTSDVIGMQGV